jgi:1-phosphofructokinase family hexose kinase
MLNNSSTKFWCVSANPAIDKRVRLPRLVLGRVNRALEVRAMAGGKATHVAMVLRTLGMEPSWLGYAGGASGEQLVNGLRALGILVYPVVVDGDTRVNLEIIDTENCVTELLEPGSLLTEKNWEDFFCAYEALLAGETNRGMVIASGSLPPAADPECYRKFTQLAHQHGHKIFIDTNGEPLRRALSAGPDFVKPNREEAEWLTGHNIDDLNSAKAAADRLIQLGARSVVVSLGHDGLIWHLGEQQLIYYAQTTRVKARSTVGCGDATVAAFAYAASMDLAVEETLHLAVACGAANCLADSPGCLLEADIRTLQTQVRIEKLI